MDIYGRLQKSGTGRDPPLAISRAQVEAWSAAFGAWQAEIDEKRLSSWRDLKKYELTFYRRFLTMYRALTQEERVALLALAWFTRD